MVAKLAIEEITRKIKQEGCPVITSDITFCRTILHEYAVKMNLGSPSYTCKQSQGLLPTFISSVEFPGTVYQGVTGRNKKEAQQLAARAAIESILANGDPHQRTTLAQIIRSKGKLYETISQVREKDEEQASQVEEEKVNEISSDATLSGEVKGLIQSPMVNPLIAKPLTVIAEGVPLNSTAIVPQKSRAGGISLKGKISGKIRKKIRSSGLKKAFQPQGASNSLGNLLIVIAWPCANPDRYNYKPWICIVLNPMISESSSNQKMH
ncbi:uncharacterized protein LOC144700790 isoform X2 [Wolffia australiana]